MSSLGHNYTLKDVQRDLGLNIEVSNLFVSKFLNYILKDDRGTSQGGVSTFDHIEDYRYVYPSFKQLYNVDIEKDDLKWWEYIYMLEGCFSQECMLSNIVTIRCTDTAKLKGEHKIKMLDQKAKYRLRNEDVKLDSLFASLKGAVR